MYHRKKTVLLSAKLKLWPCIIMVGLSPFSYPWWADCQLNHSIGLQLAKLSHLFGLGSLNHLVYTPGILHHVYMKALVMGPGQIFLTQVGSGQFFVARVRSAIYGLGLNFKNFP